MARERGAERALRFPRQFTCAQQDVIGLFVRPARVEDVRAARYVGEHVRGGDDAGRRRNALDDSLQVGKALFVRLGELEGSALCLQRVTAKQEAEVVAVTQ